MVMFKLGKPVGQITMADVERMFPEYIGEGYCDMNIVFTATEVCKEAVDVREMVKKAVRNRGVSCTLQSAMFTSSGEPSLIVELGDVSNGR